MQYSTQMLAQNKVWAYEAALADSTLFGRISRGQSPRVLWFGCSDSRVPAESVTGCGLGDLFVHRNIANIVSPDDPSAMSVIEYAVVALQVEEIVVCGHYGCGGVRASLLPAPDELPHVGRRIGPLRALACRCGGELDRLADVDAKTNRLAELNVLEQVRSLRAMDVIRDAPQPPKIHGWIFDTRSGLIKVLDPTDE
ncbi:carbonic anhydrase [Paraburkholderia sp. MMS20-SJTR3]|uniref:Carbonic anhydrase n=1 Tax=Paraburkholderia sejongensis TaxID=2886946 RepID=A0ABS8K4E0_9BURK|nr:carbonic anhydrase [Paraburkholderia sp. MMS20-SJTR3]MCC8397021.1 carbonic anhydrase [Paraburkholderia sp. MMS20-SJTR3]